MIDGLEREELELGRQLEAGEISEADYDDALRYLYEMTRAMAEEAAEQAYNDVIGGGW